MKTKTKTQDLEAARRQRDSKLRRGHYDEDIFRMMGQDVPISRISKLLLIRAAYIKLRVKRVFDQFPEPDDRYRRRAF